MKDYQRALTIDFSIIARAQQYYADVGFKDTPAPWVIGSQAYNKTRPPEAIPYETLGGFLVASAEQSFFQLMLEGKDLGLAQATTPCFRDEQHDEIHSPYFMKTELINTATVDRQALREMVSLAQTFFEKYLKTEVIAFADGTLDIVCARTQLELGSYGIRRHEDFQWIYGTGVALPRLTYAIQNRYSAG